MQINSLSYLFFLFAAVVIFWCIPVRCRQIFILATSVIFYATWNVVFVVVPLSMCAATYAIALLMIAHPVQSRRWMCLGVIALTSALAFFKYRNFAVANWNNLMTWMGGHPIPIAAAI